MMPSIVQRAMSEAHEEGWWPSSGADPSAVQTRMERTQGFVGTAAWEFRDQYCDFGDLSSIIVTSWDLFENVVGNMNGQAITQPLEKSGNIVMPAVLAPRMWSESG